MKCSRFARAAAWSIVLVPVLALAFGTVLGQSAVGPGVVPLLVATSGEPATAPTDSEDELEQVAILEHDSGEPIFRCVKEDKKRKTKTKKKTKTKTKIKRKKVWVWRFVDVGHRNVGVRLPWWGDYRWVKYKVTTTKTTSKTVTTARWSDWTCVPKCPTGPMKGEQCIPNPDRDDPCLICPSPSEPQTE